jgi:hypothetical protein
MRGCRIHIAYEWVTNDLQSEETGFLPRKQVVISPALPRLPLNQTFASSFW